MRKAAKIPNVIRVIRQYIDSSRFLDTLHAQSRQSKRHITRPEIMYVLKHGYHERRKDKYEQRYRSWNYSVRGKTPDKKPLRVIITFEENMMLIITAIDLKR